MHDDPTPHDINIRAPCYRLARSVPACWRCGAAAPVFALALPIDHQTLEADAEPEPGAAAPADSWQLAGFEAWIFYVEYLPHSVRRQLHALAPRFRYAYNRSTDGSYWINHCERCGTAQDDYFLHCEIGGVFMPATAEAAGLIELRTIHAPFVGSAAGYSYDPPFIASMRRL